MRRRYRIDPCAFCRRPTRHYLCAFCRLDPSRGRRLRGHYAGEPWDRYGRFHGSINRLEGWVTDVELACERLRARRAYRLNTRQWRRGR